jgi:hypothetical protein
MYPIDDRDKIVAFGEVPQPSPGAPVPLIVADDVGLLLLYEVAPDGAELVVLKFTRACAHSFGLPNDEALAGHPLAKRGLRPYSIFEVIDSSWVRALERMNRVHPLHCADRFRRLRHLVFTFHDNTFECVAEDVIVASRQPNGSGAVASFLHNATALLSRPI